MGVGWEGSLGVLFAPPPSGDPSARRERVESDVPPPIVDELARDHERRLLNQRAFPKYFVKCSCRSGCAVCAHTKLVSKAEAKQPGRREA